MIDSQQKVIEVKGYYFKFLNDETAGISGCCLPSPERTYHFIDCKIHPRLWEAMEQCYNHCQFTNTYCGINKLQKEVTNGN